MGLQSGSDTMPPPLTQLRRTPSPVLSLEISKPIKELVTIIPLGEKHESIQPVLPSLKGSFDADEENKKIYEEKEKYQRPDYLGAPIEPSEDEPNTKTRDDNPIKTKETPNNFLYNIKDFDMLV